MHCFILILVLLTSNVEPNTTFNDSTVIQLSEIEQIPEQRYQELLERTNQQLSLWWTPFNTILVLLTAMITIFTIFATVGAFIVHKRWKQLVQESLEKNTAIVNEYIHSKNKNMENQINMLQENIKELRESAESDTNLQEKIDRLDKQISNLENSKLSDFIAPSLYTSGPFFLDPKLESFDFNPSRPTAYKLNFDDPLDEKKE